MTPLHHHFEMLGWPETTRHARLHPCVRRREFHHVLRLAARAHARPSLTDAERRCSDVPRRRPGAGDRRRPQRHGHGGCAALPRSFRHRVRRQSAGSSSRAQRADLARIRVELVGPEALRRASEGASTPSSRRACRFNSPAVLEVQRAGVQVISEIEAAYRIAQGADHRHHRQQGQIDDHRAHRPSAARGRHSERASAATSAIRSSSRQPPLRPTSGSSPRSRASSSKASPRSARA